MERKVVGYTFYPKYIQKNKDPQLEKKELQAKVGNIAGAYGMLLIGLYLIIFCTI